MHLHQQPAWSDLPIVLMTAYPSREVLTKARELGISPAELRRKNFVAFRALDDDLMTGPRLLQTVEKDLAALGPFTDYLCAALDLEF